jgi:DNA-binding protein HU-beta
MPVSTADLADRVSAAHGLSKSAAKAAVEDVLKGIVEAAVNGEEVSLHGFGKFKVQAKPERQARKPGTQEVVTVPASKKVVFQPAKALKDAVNG